MFVLISWNWGPQIVQDWSCLYHLVLLQLWDIPRYKKKQSQRFWCSICSCFPLNCGGGCMIVFQLQYIYELIYIYTCIYICILYMHTCSHIYIVLVCVYICIHNIYIHIYMHVFVYMCILIYIYMFTLVGYEDGSKKVSSYLSLFTITDHHLAINLLSCTIEETKRSPPRDFWITENRPGLLLGAPSAT